MSWNRLIFTGKARTEAGLKTLKDAVERQLYKKILVLRAGLMGDIVFVTPVLERLHAAFPQAQIDVMATERYASVLAGLPAVHHIYTIADDISLLKEMACYWRLRHQQYDLMIIQESNSHFTIMGLLVRAKFRIGFENKLNVLLNYTVPWLNDSHDVYAELETVRQWTNIESKAQTKVGVTLEEREQTRKLLSSIGIGVDDIVVCLHTGTSEPNSVRNWLSERYSELANRIVEKFNAKIIFTGTQADRDEAELIRSRMSYQSVNLAGQTPIRQLIGVLHRAHLVVGPDTGVLHLSNAIGTPVVMLMGYSDPINTGPFDPDGISQVVNVGLQCSPCARKEHKPAQWEICKNVRPVLCMEKMTTESVMQVVSKVLELKVRLSNRARLAVN